MSGLSGILLSSVGEIGRLLAGRQISCREVVQAHLRRIREVNPTINAVVTLVEEDSLRLADERDGELARGEGRGPLHGIPFTVKDSFSTAGVRTTCGARSLAAFVPSRDAEVVRRLGRAGAILLGKTNLPPFLSSYETISPVHGRTANPYDPKRSAGGSSGGEAAIVAACGSAFGVGSDRGGSIRLPCHYCGVAGLKPTAGAIPSAGHIPRPFGPLKAEPGPIARRVEDLSVILEALSDLPRAAAAPSGQLRVAFSFLCDGQQPDPPIRRAVIDAVTALREAGHEAREADPPGLAMANELTRSLTAVRNEAFGREVIPELFAPRELDDGEAAALGEIWLERARALAAQSTMSGFEYFCHEMRLDLLRARMDSFMSSFDAVVCPVSGSTALPHGFTTDPSLGAARVNTSLYNLSGNPAISVPAGLDDVGLPVGIQVVGRRYREEVALEVALILERARGGWSPPAL